MYAKIENGKLIPAENGYNGITGFADNVELMLENGFKFYDDSEFSLYSVGAKILDENELFIDNPEYLESLRGSRLSEALSSAYFYESNGVIEYKNCLFEMSLSNRQNLKDTEEALRILEQESTDWNSKTDEIIELTVDDLRKIRLELILGAIRGLWIIKYPQFVSMINDAQTVEQLEAIKIDYSKE